MNEVTALARKPGFVPMLTLCAASAILVLVSVLYYDVKNTLHEIEKNRADETSSLREGLFNEMVDHVTESASTDQERAIAIAAYICAHVRNDREDSKNDSSPYPGKMADPLTAWEYRRGVCGWRSRIMIRALTRLNIKAEPFNIYDYDFGHSCVLAHYDGKDHFFDPTYGGYFLGAKGHVLSWKEIQADPEKALSGLSVFPKTLDSYQDGTRASNDERMRQVYTAKSIASVKNAGVIKSGIFVLPVLLDVGAGESPLVLGRLDGDENDMRSDDVTGRTRCWYLNILGASNENFAYAMRLKGLKSGKPVAITFRFCDKGYGKARFLADSDTGRIISGAEGPLCRNANIWRILYQPTENAENVVTIRLSSYSEKSFALLDSLSVEQDA